jgi:hypothetical protein
MIVSMYSCEQETIMMCASHIIIVFILFSFAPKGDHLLCNYNVICEFPIQIITEQL